MKVNIEQKNYGKRIALKNIRVEFPVGKTTLIIGTSGAGKSTLIKCMTGTTSFQGEISDYKREAIAYIPQHPALNIRETAWNAVYWSARFSRLYRGKEELESVVNKYISMMGLQTVENQEINSLSGGQTQRVSIAKELIRGKSIIIADEIDTGLDCGVSRDLVSKLCGITQKNNMTTIIISHNIVNLELYDQVVVLVKDSNGTGRVCYSGSPQEIRSFFEVKDAVDILTKINSRSEGGMGLAGDYIEKYNKYLRI